MTSSAPELVRMAATDLSPPTEPCTEGDVRLVGGPNEFQGHVEACLGGGAGGGDVEWRRWCSGDLFNDISFDETSVICNQIEGALPFGK